MKVKRGIYRITPKGLMRFNEISVTHRKGKKLNYPPKIITKKRNYEDWILWMVYNNNYCKWSDFLEPPLSINRHSLSKKINQLKEQNYIKHENKEYRITRSGKLQYSKMLEKYDLDRQSILNEESKRIEEITSKTLSFFKKFGIEDEEIQYRFLTNSLKLDYSRVNSMLTDQSDFEKILLYLSINHPDYFPDSMALDEFAKKYDIKETKLSYYIDEIVENQIYPIKFFKLSLPDGSKYYFQEDETIELMLRAITEKFITKFTYLSQLKSQELHLGKIEEKILDEANSKVFHPDLKDLLKKFLPGYIDYLAYKMEAKVELKETYDKLGAIIWQNVMDTIQKRQGEIEFVNFDDSIREIEQSIQSNPDDIELYLSKCAILKYYNKYDDLLELLDEMLQSFPDLDLDLNMKKADVYKLMGNIMAGYDIIEGLNSKYPDQSDLQMYQAYWLMYMDNKDESLKVMKTILDREPKKGVYYDTYGELLMNYEDYESAIAQFEKTIKLSVKEWFIPFTYIKLGICYKELENYDMALEYLMKGKEYMQKSKIDPLLQKRWIIIADLFQTEIKNILD
ncbi:MAG: hypothetical protein EU533_08050 [Promethearchaeota archaeon]|nr:MAG: hypothetical protein EU533_08050 [Candidatus Lokiarchaeota archaeon]